jgi:hypothetical protein
MYLELDKAQLNCAINKDVWLGLRLFFEQLSTTAILPKVSGSIL